MKKLLIAFLAFYTTCCFSQDLIIKKDGNILECRILKTDSFNVFFKYIRDDKEIDTYLSLDKVKELVYEADIKNVTQTPDVITYVKSDGMYKYYHKNRMINTRVLSGLLSLNNAAYEQYKEYRGNKALSNIFGFAGGFLMGWNIGHIIIGQEPNWYVFGGGAFLALISVPISFNAIDYLHNAIDLYNRGLKSTSSVKKEVIFGLHNGKPGLRIMF